MKKFKTSLDKLCEVEQVSTMFFVQLKLWILISSLSQSPINILTWPVHLYAYYIVTETIMLFSWRVQVEASR